MKMNGTPPGHFDGSLLSVTGYHLSIVDTSPLYRAMLNSQSLLDSEYHVRWDETEDLYAWCVVQSISDAFREIRILGHYHNSLYQEVYDGLISGFSHSTRAVVLPVLERLPSIRAMRVLPLLDKTILAILQ